MKKIEFLAIWVMVLLLFSTLWAGSPPLINYQGRLASGQGVPLDTSVSMTFTIYDTEIGGQVIWIESQSAIEVVGGIFNVLLGTVTPVSDTVFSGEERWLGVKVGSDPEIVPRSRLVSVGYAHRVATIDGARGGRIDGDILVGGNGGASTTDLRITNTMALVEGVVRTGQTGGIDRMVLGTLTPHDLAFTAGNATQMTIKEGSGNVGIGTISPSNKFEVASNDGIVFRVNTVNGITRSNGQFEARNGQGSVVNFIVEDGGYVGIGKTAPEYRLDVDGNIRTESGVIAGTFWTGDGTSGNIRKLTPGIPLHFRKSDGTQEMTIDGSGNVGIGTTSPSQKLEVVGTTKTQILEITGGSDLAEPFETTRPDDLIPGTVVIIDEANPGKLKMSETPYDTRVAGVVSGAGGIKPGLTLKQEGVIEGTHNITLSGRVYVLASAVNGPIRPGDLLTTSSIPGHCMKATDQSRWPGAVIGKAMSSMETGTGLVLVLVNLQ